VGQALCHLLVVCTALPLPARVLFSLNKQWCSVAQIAGRPSAKFIDSIIRDLGPLWPRVRTLSRASTIISAFGPVLNLTSSVFTSLVCHNCLAV
jgi:hypothetical protein